MEYTRLGQTDLRVSRLCFGTWSFGGEWGAVREEEHKAAIRRALELGITFFDTAQAYGFGTAERILGAALRPKITGRRDKIVIATKGGLRRQGTTLVRDASPTWLRRGLEESLHFLGTDYVDLYQIHWPDPQTPIAETVGALEDFVREGKVRHVGVSNFDVLQMEEFRRYGRLETLQPPYHLFRREIEREILPYAAAHDIGVLAYGPLAHGLLAGQMTPATMFPADDWRSTSPDFQGETFRRNLAVVEQLKEIARELGITLVQLAVAWTLANPAVDVAIVGARRPSQIEGTAAVTSITLSAADLCQIDRVLADTVPVRGPAPEAMPEAVRS